MIPANMRVMFIALWSILQLARLILAAQLPLHVDEAFYAWEARFPAWAYSDLPGLTAALARLGMNLGGAHPLALRLPFLLLGAAVPWLVVAISRRWFGAAAGWQAGLLALLMPLSGLLGVLALPDVPLVFAALLCVVAIAGLRDRVQGRDLFLLAAALAIGALAHYRFALVVAAGLAGLAWDARARALLREPRVWLALAAGIAAWWPLLAWNLGHDSAGLRFQFVDRNPWHFHADGLAWLPIQFLLVTPALFLLLLATLGRAWRRRREGDEPWALILGIAAVSVPGYFLLGFFADADRVSFHWPLAGWLLLLAAAPPVLRQWRRGARRAVFGLAGVGLLLGLGFLSAAALPAGRQSLADTAIYPKDFGGWQELRAAARRAVPAGTRLLAGDFAIASQLAFALDRRQVEVLDSPANHKHGRAAQLEDWGLAFDADADRRASAPGVLVIEDSATPMKHRLRAYHRLCAQFGALPEPQVLTVDHGRKRFLFYRVGTAVPAAPCRAPALAWIDAPVAGAGVPPAFTVQGWAFKDGPGLVAVEVTVDGKSLGRAEYGLPMPGVAAYWEVSRDPNHPGVGFRLPVAAGKVTPGPHWLGLRLHATDGSVEDWPEQRILVQETGR